MTVCYWCGAKDTLADIGKELDDGKYKMVQCSKCKNAYYVVNKEKMKKPKPMTNEEWLEQASTEEKAKFLRKIYCDGRDDYVGEWYEQEEEDFVQWLKEKHNA